MTLWLVSYYYYPSLRYCLFARTGPADSSLCMSDRPLQAFWGLTSNYGNATDGHTCLIDCGCGYVDGGQLQSVALSMKSPKLFVLTEGWPSLCHNAQVLH